MLHDFELHELFHSPKNVLLKALLYYAWYSKVFCNLDVAIKELALNYLHKAEYSTFIVMILLDCKNKSI